MEANTLFYLVCSLYNWAKGKKLNFKVRLDNVHNSLFDASVKETLNGKNSLMKNTFIFFMNMKFIGSSDLEWHSFRLVIEIQVFHHKASSRNHSNTIKGSFDTHGVWCSFFWIFSKPWLNSIPKKKPIEHTSNFRPICFCNLIYKFLSKVISKRLSHILSIIDDDQGGFVLVCGTTNNVIIVLELLDSILKQDHRLRGISRHLVIKLDMKLTIESTGDIWNSCYVSFYF